MPPYFLFIFQTLMIAAQTLQLIVQLILAKIGVQRRGMGKSLERVHVILHALNMETAALISILCVRAM